MECGQIKEDLFYRQLWDLSCYPNSIAWSEAGSTATMTNCTIHVHTAKFEYMAVYKAKWVSLEQKPPSYQPEGMQPGKQSSLTDWLRDNSVKEGSTHFRSVSWCNDILSCEDRSPLLTLLLTDGTLLFVSVADREAPSMGESGEGEQANNRAKDGIYPVESYTNTNCTLSLHGVSLCLDCSSAYKKYCAERRLDLVKQRIRCTASCSVFANTKNSMSILVLASYNRVTFWRMQYEACNDEGGTSCYNMRGERVQLRMHYLTECTLANTPADFNITALLVCNTGTDSSASTTKETIHVMCATNDGEVLTVRFEMSLDQAAASSSATAPRTVAATQSLVCKKRIFDTPISGMHMLGNSAVCFVSGAWAHTVPLTTLVASVGRTASATPLGSPTLLVSKGAISGLVVIPSIDDSAQSTINVCSTYGELKSFTYTHSAPATSAAATATATGWSQPTDLANKANGYSMFGVAADPSGLLTAYVYRNPAIHYNSREVQLNNSLRAPRSAIAWKTSPSVEQDFAASVLKTASVLLRLVRSAADRAESAHVSSQLSFAALPLAFLQSLECDASRTFYRSKLTDLKSFEQMEGVSYYPAVKSTTTVKAEGSSVADEDSDSGEEDERGSAAAGDSGADSSDSEDSVSLAARAALGQQGAAGSSRKQLLSRAPGQDAEVAGSMVAPSGSTGKKKFSTKDNRKRTRRRVSNMNVVYDRVAQLARPSRQEAVQLAVETIFDAAVVAALTLQQGYVGGAIAEDIGDTVSAMDLDQKIQALFCLPSVDDHKALERKIALWQCLHLLLLSLHRTVGVSEIGADYEHLPDSLRQVLHKAHCIRSLQRVLSADGAALSAANGNERQDMQSVYFMSQVLALHFSSLPESDPAAATLEALVQSALQWLQTPQAHHSGSSAAKDRFGCEMCAICTAAVPFLPYDDSEETAPPGAAHSKLPPQVKGGSVLHGTCESCTVRVERCCFSLRMITTSAESCGISGTSGVGKRMSEKVYRCELCSAVTSLALFSTVTAPGSLIREGSSLFCPYCSIPMNPL